MIKKWFFSLTRAKQITICVLGAHFALLFIWTGSYWISPRPHLPKKVTVRTVQIPKPPPPKSTPASNKNLAQAKPSPKKIPTPSKPAQSKSLQKEKILKEIASNLKEISQKPNQTKPEIKIPLFHLENQEESPENFSEQIALFLEEMLQLPEFGKVKAHLTIDRFGKLISLEILESASDKNVEFLKNQLPILQYPCLNKGATLTIVFSNAI